MTKPLGGTIQMSINGRFMSAKGTWTYNLGRPKMKAMVGACGQIDGFVETPQVGFIEGAITDRADMDLAPVLALRNGLVVLHLANGKIIALHRACFAGEGSATTDEGEIAVRFEGLAEEMRQ